MWVHTTSFVTEPNFSLAFMPHIHCSTVSVLKHCFGKTPVVMPNPTDSYNFEFFDHASQYAILVCQPSPPYHTKSHRPVGVGQGFIPWVALHLASFTSAPNYICTRLTAGKFVADCSAASWAVLYYTRFHQDSPDLDLFVLVFR
jgi:hypothetical protein